MSGTVQQESFKALFGLPEGDFGEPINLIDAALGFSVYKKFHRPGYKSLFRIYVRNEDLQTENPVKQLHASASFGKETEDGITVSSTSWKRSNFDPIDISSTDFSFDVSANKFFYKSREISAKDLLATLDRFHTKTVRPVWGFWLRLKIFLVLTILANLVKFFFYSVAFIQYLISGQKIRIYDNVKELDDRSTYSPERLSVTPSKPIKVFDYEVETWVAVLYASLHLIGFIVLDTFFTVPTWINKVLQNNFLTIMYAIPTLGLANAALPAILKERKVLHLLLGYIQNLYYRVAGRNISVDDLDYKTVIIWIEILIAVAELAYLVL